MFELSYSLIFMVASQGCVKATTRSADQKMPPKANPKTLKAVRLVLEGATVAEAISKSKCLLLHSAKLRGPRQESACALTGRGGTTDVPFQRVGGGGGGGGGGSVRSAQAIPEERRRPRGAREEAHFRRFVCRRDDAVRGRGKRAQVNETPGAKTDQTQRNPAKPGQTQPNPAKPSQTQPNPAKTS